MAAPTTKERTGLTAIKGHELAERIARICDEKLARDIVILDMTPVVGYTDAFVICTGNTGRQVQAIAGEVARLLKQEDRTLPVGGEGKRDGEWVLLDYLDAILHVFTPEARAFYRLEQLWGQVPARQYASSAAS